MNIGERIKKRREALGMTQEELAFAVGYSSRTTIAIIEKGINDVPQSKVVDLAKILRTTPSYLLGDDEDLNQDDTIIDFLLKSGTSATITTNNSRFVESLKFWEKEVGLQDVTDEELVELANYAKYLRTKRK
jgi:transcriptional regulator with XRE-family HTH domain